MKDTLFMFALSVVVSAGMAGRTAASAAEGPEVKQTAKGAAGVARKGEPLPVSNRHIPYEDVLDHCDLVLAGKVIK